MLGYFDSNKKLVIETDMFDYMTTVVIFQKTEEEVQLLRFMFKKMTSVKQNYIIIEKKMLVIIQPVKKWRKYFKRAKTKVKIITNYKNLIYFQEAKITNRQQVQ